MFVANMSCESQENCLYMVLKWLFCVHNIYIKTVWDEVYPHQSACSSCSRNPDAVGLFHQDKAK